VSKRAILALILWLLALGLNGYYTQTRGLSPLQAFQAAVDWLRASPWGPVVFVVAFTLRPVLLLPASLLSISAGYCFGIWGGLLCAHGAGAVAGAAGYLVGRWVGLRRGVAEGWVEHLRARGFYTVVFMRWCFLPYDLVSYLAGALRIPLAVFLWASFLGNLPGTTSCVLLGASVEGPLDQGGIPPINWRLQFASWVIIGGMMALGRFVQTRRLPPPK
jgi:uncharacterized membrane protein YdjX (TVP38/TMEM64 family)